MIGLTKELKINSSFIMASAQISFPKLDIDGIMGLGNMESTNDFIDLAYEQKYIQVFLISIIKNKWIRTKCFLSIWTMMIRKQNPHQALP